MRDVAARDYLLSIPFLGHRMTVEKLKSLFELYGALPDDRPVMASLDSPNLTYGERRDHVNWMCKRALGFLDSADGFEKANRWLGFVQGALWASGVFTIDEMRAHNRED